MTKSLTDKLTSLDHASLVEIITNLVNEHLSIKKSIATLTAMNDPKEMYKVLNKEITSLKNSKKFINYYESNHFTAGLEAILDKIEKYLAQQEPDLALKLCKRFIEIDANIMNRIDDSNGCMGDFYYHLYEVLDKIFPLSSDSPEQVAKYLIETYFADEYGTRSSLFDVINHCLTDEVISEIEKNIPPIKSISNTPELDVEQEKWDFKTTAKNYAIIAIKKRIADKQKDVDAYIHLCQLNRLSAQDICEISKRLNNAFRSEEAITWLLKLNPDEYGAANRDKLLVEAYMLEYEEDKAKAVIWSRFKRHVHVKDYLHFLKLAKKDEILTAKTEAVNIARQKTPLSSGFQFLHEVQEYDEIENLFFENIHNLDGSDYYVFRKLSTDMDKQGKHLVATLMRRKLAEDVLNAARSKSYKYAVSDLKKAADFAQSIQDWKNFIPHSEYITQLKTKHARKHSFWHQMSE